MSNKSTQQWPVNQWTGNKSMVLAQMSKSNSRTFQGLSRTIRRIFKNYINQKTAHL